MVRSILVTGATGKQGGAVIKALLAITADFEILAVTRNPHKKSAQALVKLSPRIKLIAGNLDDPRDMFQNAKDVAGSLPWGVFSVQPIHIGPGADVGLEQRQGIALIDAALENSVQHFVYSSVDRGGESSDHQPTNIPHFMSKHNIEKHLEQRAKGNGMGWTILRPVAFFENLIPGFMGKVFATNLKRSLRERKKLQFIATSDIGHMAALSFTRPEQFQDRKISLAGDELSYTEFKQIFYNTTGQRLPTTLRLITSLLNWAFGELGCMFRWFQVHGYAADIASVKEIHPRLKDFASWLREESQFETLKAEPMVEVLKTGSLVTVG